CMASFFFQAEDGIRDFHVTGVQTCALPISQHVFLRAEGLTGLHLLAEDVKVVRADTEDFHILQYICAEAHGSVDVNRWFGTGYEIGRASCRERGKGAGAGGSGARRGEGSGG